MEVKDAVQIASTHAKELMESKEYVAQKFVSQYFLAMRAKILTAIAEVNKWKRVIIYQRDAEEKVNLEYMTKSERELWQKYFETPGQKKHLEEFLQTLKKPDEKYKEEILMVTHRILQANTHARKMLKRASEELEKAVDDRRNALFVKTMEEPQTSFKTREVYDLIRRQYRALKKEHEDLFVDKFHLQRQIISPERAIFMAKNIFVHGDYKRLREDFCRYKKRRAKAHS